MTLAVRIEELERAVKTKRSAGALAEAESLFKESPSNDDAARLLLDFIAAYPEDSVAQHHLAIHSHSRAFELEAEGNAEFEAAFCEAHKCWQQLMACEDFWDGLCARGRENGGDRFLTSTVDEARVRLPRWLLEFHVKQVLTNRRSQDEALKLKTRRHMRVILTAPFPEAVAACREEIFHAFCELAVQYEHGGNQSDNLEKAAAIIEDYLELDPKYLDARREHLRFLGLLGQYLDDEEYNFPIRFLLERLHDVVERGRPSETMLASGADPLANAARATAFRTRALLELLRLEFDDAAGSIKRAISLDPDAPMTQTFNERRLQPLHSMWRESKRKIDQGDLQGGYNDRLNVYLSVRAYDHARRDLKKLRAHPNIRTSTIDSILREIEEKEREDQSKGTD